MIKVRSVPGSLTTDEARWDLLQRKAQEARVTQAFRLLRENGIEPILIKGLAAARLYPATMSRLSIDMDLAVAAGDMASAEQVRGSDAAKGLAIDLHCELRHLDTVNWDDLFNNSEFLDLDDYAVRVLRPEDHLRVLCVHWLTDGGSNKERLWDIYYAIENRRPDFDWDRFLGVVNANRRRWFICTIGLAHHFLGLNINDTPIAKEARDLPAWLIKTVEREWASGTRTLPLEVILKDRKMLVKQLRKRIPPNPLWATVQMEGSFDARTRVFYQIANLFQRVAPSYRRISATLRAGE